MSKFRVFPRSLASDPSKARLPEYIAAATIAVIIVLNVIGVASRNKPAEFTGQRVSENLPAPHLAGDTLSPPSAKQRVKAAQKRQVAPTYASPPLPSQAASVNLFQPQKRILDATGAPALDPNRGAPLPLKLDILSHVDEAARGFTTASIPDPTDGGVLAAQSGASVQHRAHYDARGAGTHLKASRQTIADAKATRKKREAVTQIAAAPGVLAPPGKTSAKVIPGDAKARAKLAAAAAQPQTDAARKPHQAMTTRLTRNDPTPGELVLIALRGPV